MGNAINRVATDRATGEQSARLPLGSALPAYKDNLSAASSQITDIDGLRPRSLRSSLPESSNRLRHPGSEQRALPVGPSTVEHLNSALSRRRPTPNLSQGIRWHGLDVW